MTDERDERRLAADLRSAIEDLNRLHDQQVDLIRREHAAQIDALTRTYRAEIARLRAVVVMLRNSGTETP